MTAPLPVKALVAIGGEPVEVRFHESEHAYIDATSEQIPSVTSLMKPITNKAYQTINQEILRSAAELGTAVHTCTEFFDSGDLDEASVDADWLPYLNAYKRFISEFQPKIVAIEQRLACQKWSGTIDRVVELNDEVWIVDIKTTSAIHDFAGIQLAGYETLWRIHHPGEKRTIRRGILQLKDDESYKFKEFCDVSDFACFSALVTINQWERNHE